MEYKVQQSFMGMFLQVFGYKLKYKKLKYDLIILLDVMLKRQQVILIPPEVPISFLNSKAVIQYFTC